MPTGPARCETIAWVWSCRASARASNRWRRSRRQSAQPRSIRRYCISLANRPGKGHIRACVGEFVTARALLEQCRGLRDLEHRHREQFHQSRLIELANRARVQYQHTLQQVTHCFVDRGSSMTQAKQQAAWIGHQVQAQASYLDYVDVFWIPMPVSAAAVPLALILRKLKLGSGAAMVH